jgi:hypothetical protein
METVLKVEIRSVYGEDKVYPVNNQAQMLANIAGTTTLTTKTLLLAGKMGFRVETVTKKLVL